MSTQIDDDVLSVDGEVARIEGGSSSFYYCVNTPKSHPRLKIEKECQMEMIIFPYRTTKSPRTQPGKLYYFRDYFKYNGLGPSQKDSYFDMAQTFGEPCSIADAYQGMGTKPRSQRMGLFNVFVLSIDDVPVNKPYVLDFSYANFAEKLFTASNTKKKRKGQEHAGFFADAKLGSILTFTWKEETMKTNGRKFFVASEFDFSPHNGLDGIVAQNVAQAIDLDAALNKLSYEDAKAKFVDCVAAPAATRPAANTGSVSAPPPADADVPADDEPFDASWS
jgi:hypothetical protein